MPRRAVVAAGGGDSTELVRLRRAVSDLTLDKMILAEDARGTEGPRRRAYIEHVRSELKVSDRRVCLVLRQHHSTQRLVPMGRDGDDRLSADIIELARQYGPYGYRKIAARCFEARRAVSMLCALPRSGVRSVPKLM